MTQAHYGTQNHDRFACNAALTMATPTLADASSSSSSTPSPPATATATAMSDPALGKLVDDISALTQLQAADLVTLLKVSQFLVLTTPTKQNLNHRHV